MSWKKNTDYLMKKNISLAVFTQKIFPDLTSHLMADIHAVCTANNFQIDERKQRLPLRKPAVPTLKNSTEEGEEMRGEKNIPLKKICLELARHGKILIFDAYKKKNRVHP